MKPKKINKKALAFAQLSMNVASIALGIEALEQIFVEKGVLAENELMGRVESMLKQKEATQ